MSAPGKPIPKDTAPADALPARQEAMAALVASGMTLAAAGRKSRVGAATAKRWGQTPAFRERVRELRRELTDRTLSLLATASADAVKTMTDLLAAKADGTKLRAADALLTHAVRHREADLTDLMDELTARVQAVETTRRIKR